MIIIRKNTVGFNSFLLKKKEGGGFLGKLWRGIKENIGSIIGSLLGGPIGFLIGTAIQSIIKFSSDTDGYSGRIEQNIDLIQEDEYPINPIEEALLFKWFNNQFKPTIINISNSVDQSLILTASKSIANNKLTAINKALKDLSILKAHALHLQKFGEYQTGYFSTTKFSDNYVINKVEAMFLVLDAVEKSIIKYMVDNGFTDYKLTAQAQNISSINQVGQVAIDWQGQNVEANIKQYKEASQVNTTEVIDVTNIDLTNTDPATSTDTEVINAEGQAKPTNNKLLKAAGVTTAIVLIGKALKNKKKTK